MQSDSNARIHGGSVELLRLLDVANVIDLDVAEKLAARRGASRGETQVRGPDKVPGGVVLGSNPLDLPLDDLLLAGFEFAVHARLFDFGVVSLRFSMKLADGMTTEEMIDLSDKLEQLTLLDAKAREVWNELASDLRESLREEHSVELFEDYTIFHVRGVRGVTDAKEALALLQPAELLLAEAMSPLASSVKDAHQSRAIQYYAFDAAVIGWSAALVIDPHGHRDELEVLELATARRLELRYYDQLLSRELAAVYRAAGDARKASSLFRSPFVHVARRAGTLFIEITDLYDRLEGALTLVGDAYTSRLYREAAERFRLGDLSSAVKEKLGTLSRVSEIFEAEIGHRRTTVLEVSVVALIFLELILGLVRAH